MERSSYHGFIAVSYTHLDVYKRQKEVQKDLEKNLKYKFSYSRDSIVAVSYTHLDVYKRQL